MAVGVFVAQSGSGAPFILHYSADLFGYAMHGLGLVPFTEHLTK